KTRYRQTRFLNRVRSKHKGWLAPSVQSRVDNIVEWSKRFMRLSPVGFITVESVKFDMQKMENAAVEGIEYQRGTLFDYEVKELGNINVPVLTGTGAETKYNRVSQGYKKEHYIDALCAGTTGAKVYIPKKLKPLLIKKERRNNRQMCLVDKYGFPRGKAKGSKIVHGFKTGDIVKAVVLKGKKKGTYKGKVAVRSSGSFNIKVKQGIVEGIGWKNCVMLYRFDGYSYTC
ncbi:TPA: RRXRR domain-containing protein, partial [Enterobacter hormaechei subsp. xiangfangensis]